MIKNHRTIVSIFKVEVRNITQRIGSLSDQLDAAVALSEPRENAFITAEFSHNEAHAEIETALSSFGRVRSSTTLPGNYKNEVLCFFVFLFSSFYFK